MEHFSKVQKFCFRCCNPSAEVLFASARIGICHNKARKRCPIKSMVNQFFWAAAQICGMRMFHVNRQLKRRADQPGERPEPAPLTFGGFPFAMPSL